MPRTPINYANTIIYKLCHKDDFENLNIYVGSTTNFRKRKNSHKLCCNTESKRAYTFKKYRFIRENGGWDEWNMIEIEKYPCNDGNEARSREEHWRCFFNSHLNSIRAYISPEDLALYHKEYNKAYYDTHKQQFAEYFKTYRQKHKEALHKYNQAYYQRNKEAKREINNIPI